MPRGKKRVSLGRHDLENVGEAFSGSSVKGESGTTSLSLLLMCMETALWQPCLGDEMLTEKPKKGQCKKKKKKKGKGELGHLSERTALSAPLCPPHATLHAQYFFQGSAFPQSA